METTGFFDTKGYKRLDTQKYLQNSHKQEKSEYQYLDLIKRIIKKGESRNNRTGTGTFPIFSPDQLRFSLRDNTLPMLTTKRVFFRGIIEELLWFIRGETDVQKLHEKNIHLLEQNLHFGAKYTNCNNNYDNHSNSADTKKMALLPCHIMVQFYVHSDRSISCYMYQRSCDIGLGVPFNICSYAILTYMLAHMTGLTANELIINMGDAYVYKNHIEGLKEQIQRETYKFLFILFNYFDYNPHKTIKLEMFA
ncbi:thymidylate synthase/dCMP hydroxymethylase domain-containing protein [Gigaspora rosea]|uniref:thymidylate synthase n=1 Tax=Gigaspora rosea TaxID=44941 RepID=A0A397UFL2_9GLOM|nr:thymidylate synthase/dCMP hydroxymethylase domain-containing protein [Gigaspora rosea]